MKVIIVILALIVFVTHHSYARYGTIFYSSESSSSGSNYHLLVIQLFLLYLLVDSVISWLRQRKLAKESPATDGKASSEAVSPKVAVLQYELKKAQRVATDLQSKLGTSEEKRANAEKRVKELEVQIEEATQPKAS